MTISPNNKIEDILRQYTRSIVPKKSVQEKSKPADIKTKDDSVTISEDGRKKMRDKFQNDVISYLRTKY